MTDNKQNLIASLVDKIKGENSLIKSPFVTYISNVKYKYTLFKSKDDGCFHKAFAEEFDYIRRQDLCMFHVANEEMGAMMYQALFENQICFEDIPDEFKSIKFTVVKKLKRVVLISFNIDSNSYLLNSCNRCSKEAFLSIHNLVSWFNNTFLLNDKMLKVDYEKFICEFLEREESFLCSFFSAIYLNNSSYEFAYSKLDSIVNSLLYFCSFSKFFRIKDLQSNIQEHNNPFYHFINLGIYMEEMDEAGFNRLPYYLRINIFKYALDGTSFTSFEDFFKVPVEMEEYDGNILFSKRLFEENIELVNENEDFVVYHEKTNALNMRHKANFMKINDEVNISNVQEAIKFLSSEKLIQNASLIYSQADSKYYLCDYKDKSKVSNLLEYVRNIGDKEKELSDLLLLVNDTFSSRAAIRKKVFLKADTSYMNLLCLDNETGSLNFADITSLLFNKNNGYVTFQYPLCIMQIIDEYMAHNNIKIDDIYKCQFVKLFPQNFVSEIIKYLDTKEYNAKGMIGKLKDVLSNGDESKIEFLENISLSDTEIISRVSFIPEFMGNELVCKIKNAKVKNKSKMKAEYISLDESVSTLANNMDLCLTKKLLDKLICCLDSDTFFAPEKVIISKDIYNEKNYKIIGVLWNTSKLYRLSDLIENKDITVQNIYQIIVCKLMQMYDEGYFADKLSTGIGSLLFDQSYNMYFDFNSYKSQKDVCHERIKSLDIYYRDIMKLITREFGEKLQGLVYFTANSLEFCEKDSYTSYDEIFSNIKFCKEHEKLYLLGDMCEDCKELYVVRDVYVRVEYNSYICDIDFLDMRIKKSAGSDEEYMVWRSNKHLPNIIESVKLGIKHNLYNKFVALAPKKILITKYVDNKDVYGIVCDKYDFSNMKELESFQYMQRLKVVLMLYKKILPHIQEGSFIVQHKEVFSTMFMDKQYKGEFIVPKLPLIRCDISVSENENLKNQEKEKTLKLFSEFVYEYIESDETIKEEIRKENIHIARALQSIKECDFTEEHIRKYLESKDCYCKVHGKYFSSSDKICPECIASGIDKEKVIILDKTYFDNLKSKQADYEGGEAKLYFTNKGQIDKIFNNDNVNIEFKSKVIGKALQKGKQFEEFNNTNSDVQFVQINEVLYSNDNGVLNLEGYRQSFIKDSFKISSLKEKNFVNKMKYDKKDIIEILIEVCKGIEFLHSIGGFIGDLNGGNILIKDKTIYIIDMDGMSYDDVRNCVYTNMYIYPPSAESKNITALDDWYSLAVQAFYYLTYSHPFRGICSSRRVPVNEVERMKYGFSVLGNHGITPPNVSIGWNLMPKQMVDFFLETFEGDRRENMLETLNSYLEYISKNEMVFERIVRKHQVAREVTENIYIDVDGNIYYKEDGKFHFALKTGDFNFETYGDSSIFYGYSNCAIINDKTGETFIFNKGYDSSVMHVHNNKIYYCEDDTVYVDEVDTVTQNITTCELKRKTNNPVWTMDCKDDDKFVILEYNNEDNTYDIYCNMIKVCSLPSTDFADDEDAVILNDEITGNWIVIISCYSKLRCVLIESTGKHSIFDLDLSYMPEALDFYKNTLYYVEDKKICMYNVKLKKLKTTYCSEANLESNISRIANKFIIVNEKTIHRYIKS